MLCVWVRMVAIRGGYRMARGWHYAKLSLSSALLLSSSGMFIVLLLFLFLFLSLYICFGVGFGFLKNEKHAQRVEND